MSAHRPTSDEGMRARLALALILLIALALVVLLFREVPVSNRDLLNVALGVLLASLKDVYGYSFGSSAGRDRQAETLSNVAQVAAQAAAGQGGDAIVVPPGGQATATATPAGTVIQKDTPDAP